MLTVVQRDGTTSTVAVKSGHTVLELCREADVSELEAVCGGNCSCATCHVYVRSADGAELPPMTEDENDLLDGSSHRTESSRLACQLMIAGANADLTIVVAPED